MAIGTMGSMESDQLKDRVWIRTFRTQANDAMIVVVESADVIMYTRVDDNIPGFGRFGGGGTHSAIDIALLRWRYLSVAVASEIEAASLVVHQRKHVTVRFARSTAKLKRG